MFHRASPRKKAQGIHGPDNFFSLGILTMASFWLLLTLGDVIDQTQNIKKYHCQPNYHPLIIQ